MTSAIWSARLRVALPALAVVALVPWLVYCGQTYPDHALYFDQSMYQYTGWCIRHGEKLYATVAVPDGPLITWLHAAVQIVAGESDAAFRWADLAMQLLGASAIGYALAPLRRRGLWAAAIAALWLAQYFRYDWHWTAQREAYYALVGYLGMALLVLATRRRGRRALVLAAAGGALVGSQLFGKQTGVIFVVLGLVPCLLAVRRKQLVGYALAGMGGAIALCVMLLALTGSLAGFWFWYVHVPGVYRYLMGSADPIALLWAIDRHTTVLAAAALVAGVAAVWLRVMPRSYLGFAAAPVLFLVAMVLQRKGHIYQAHPITAGTYAVFAIITFHLARSRHLLVGAALVVLLVADATWGLATSDWIDPDPPNSTSQLGAAHVNFGDLSAAGRAVAAVTGPDDRVFAYGPAGRLLYEARRRPAVPPFNNFFFNIRRASMIELTAGQRADLERLQRNIARRSCPRLDDAPAVVVVCDHADWSGGLGLDDAREVCPQLAYVKPPAYAHVGSYGCWQIWKHSNAER